MNPSEWSRVQLVFGGVFDLAPGERSRFLDRHCGAEGTVRRAVEELLVEHEQRTGCLDQPLFPSSSQPEDDVWTGRVLNSRYRIERFIARGGMAAVYLAHDQQLAGRRVIVKVLHAWAPPYAWLKTRFRQEMEALARIDHQAVVGVLDTGETADGLPFLVIEYINGVTLRSEMGRGPMPSKRVAGLIRQIAKAVAAAHSKGVLHRDLKPENIMLELPGTAEECVRLIDFGIARLAEAEGEFASRTTQFAGTTPYMSPEQLRGKPSAASDTYAMVVVAYEMLAGQRPFSGANPIEIYEQQRSGASLTPLLQQGVPESAARLIARQLAFRPEDRGETATEAGEALADALLHPGNRIWPRRRMVRVLAAGAMAAAAGGLIMRTWLPLSDADRSVELPIPSEPLEHGFRSTGEIQNRAVHNSINMGYEALRLISTDQGGYHHTLSRAQAAAAHRLGWKVTFEAAAEEGETYCMVDIHGFPVRYAVEITSRPGGPDVVILTNGITPAIRGVELPLAGAPGARHRYRLALPPGARSAELWVDGVKRYAGYDGEREYLYRRGPEIGVARYRSARGAGVFWSFRFEIG